MRVHGTARLIVPPEAAPDWSGAAGWGCIVTTWSVTDDVLRVCGEINVFGLPRSRWPEYAALLTPYGLTELGTHQWSGYAHYDRIGQRFWTYDGIIPAALLAEWDAAAAEMAPRMLRESGLPDRIYIRWGALPRGGRSRNYVSGEMEAGVSAYEAEWNPATDCIEFVEDGTMGGTAFGYVMSGRTDIYLLTGDEVGRGSDDEPVLRDALVIGALRYDCEARGFRVVKRMGRKR